jgi:hypothetical protein
MSPGELGLLVGLVVFGVTAPVLYALVRWRKDRRRSRIESIKHQVDGPYRKVGQKRRR